MDRQSGAGTNIGGVQGDPSVRAAFFRQLEEQHTKDVTAEKNLQQSASNSVTKEENNITKSDGKSITKSENPSTNQTLQKSSVSTASKFGNNSVKFIAKTVVAPLAVYKSLTALTSGQSGKAAFVNTIRGAMPEKVDKKSVEESKVDKSTGEKVGQPLIKEQSEIVSSSRSPSLPEDVKILSDLKNVIDNLGKGDKLVLKDGQDEGFSIKERAVMSKLTGRNVGGEGSQAVLEKLLGDLGQISKSSNPDRGKGAQEILNKLENNEWVKKTLSKNVELSSKFNEIRTSIEFDGKFSTADVHLFSTKQKEKILEADSTINKILNNQAHLGLINDQMNTHMQKMMPNAPSATYISSEGLKHDADVETWKRTESDLNTIKRDLQSKGENVMLAGSIYSQNHGGAEATFIYSKLIKACTDEFKDNHNEFAKNENNNIAVSEPYARLQSMEAALGKVRKMAITMGAEASANQLDKMFEDVRDARVNLMKEFGVEIKLSEKY